MTIKLSLIDNDHTVCAMATLGADANENSLSMFLREINEGLIPGETAHLEIEGSKLDPMAFEITKSEL